MERDLFIRRPGKSTLRVRVQRRNRGRLARIAQAMRRAGWGDARIAGALRIETKNVPALTSLWGEFAALFRHPAAA